MHRYFEEEDFGRLSSEAPSEDVDMPDAFPHGQISRSLQSRPKNNTPAGYEYDSMAQGSQTEPIPSIEKDVDEPKFPKFVIAIDFGTTFSSVGFVRLDPGTQAHMIGPDSINCIDHFPDIPPSESAEILAGYQTVPTELMCYPRDEKPRSEDSPLSDLWDKESRCSLDDMWAPESAEESDEEIGTNIKTAVPKEDWFRNSVWGWGVHARLSDYQTIPGVVHLKNFKLLLDENSGESSDVKGLRSRSARELKTLKYARAVDVIGEYLGSLLKHTKARLTQDYGFHDSCPVEFVLCVPTSWTYKACATMENALTTAIKKSRFTTYRDGQLKDLFIVAESEAAAAYALEDRDYSKKLATRESFLLMDCGGGTVDAITYEVKQTTPLRLTEVVPPKGVSCGSAFLNQNFREQLTDRLRKATIVGNDEPLEKIIDARVQNFENDKRHINIVDQKAHFKSVYVQGLQEDKAHRFKKNQVLIERKDMYKVFKDCICGVSDLMLEQLNAAKEKGVGVQTVILTGGFSGSPSLENHLRFVLKGEENLQKQSIDLERSQYIRSAVARGAILRALRKEDGPERMTRCSFGYLQSLRYDRNIRKHRRFRVMRDRADGELYIMNTIQWVVHKDTVVTTVKERLRSRHIFKLDEEKFLCEEILYVSSKIHPSGYKVSHKENKGAEEAGRILIDLTFLKAQLNPITELNSEGKPYSFYEVNYDLWIIIEGRTLRFEARSPENSAEVKAACQFSIAAAFEPGTA